MLKSFELLEVPLEGLRNSEFKKTYGTLIEGMRSSRFSLFYYPFFLFRRLIYSLLLILLYENLNIQLLAIIIIALIPVFIFFQK